MEKLYSPGLESMIAGKVFIFNIFKHVYEQMKFHAPLNHSKLLTTGPVVMRLFMHNLTENEMYQDCKC